MPSNPNPPAVTTLPQRRSVRLVIIIVTVLLGGAALLGTWALKTGQDRLTLLLAARQLSRLQAQYETQRVLIRSVSSAAHAYVDAESSISLEQWDEFVRQQQLPELMPGFQYLMFADVVGSQSIVQLSGPGNRALLGQDLMRDERFAVAVREAQETGDLTTALFRDDEGSYSFAVFHPHAPAGSTLAEQPPHGFLAAIYDAEEALGGLTAVLDPTFGTVGVRLKLGNVEVVSDAYPGLASERGANRISSELPFGLEMMQVDFLYPDGYGLPRIGNAAVYTAAFVGAFLTILVMLFLISMERRQKIIRAAIERATEKLTQREWDLRVSLDETRKFQQAVEQSADQIIITDAEGTILYANDAIEAITGFSPHEAIGKKAGAKDLWGGHMPKEFYQQMWQTIKVDALPFKGEIRNRRKNGEMYDALATISPILDAAGNVLYFVATERDISREKQLERLQNDFVSITSHQLRTPLGGIRWVAERLMRKEQLSEKGYEYLQDILSSTRSLSDLVDLLLNVSRLEQEGGPGVRPEPFELVMFLEQFLSEMAPVADKKGVQLDFSASAEEIQVQSDRAAVRNIVQTYVSNALEYTPAGGRVDLRVDVIGDDIRFAVRDTGIGVPKEAQSRLFTKFHRAENARLVKPGGTGLGLYLAKKAAELLRGTVWYESEEGRGSTFYAQIARNIKGREGGGKPLA